MPTDREIQCQINRLAKQLTERRAAMKAKEAESARFELKVLREESKKRRAETGNDFTA